MTSTPSSITLRPADERDVGIATSLMKAAYAIWEPIGFSTVGLTEELVWTFLAKDGYMVEDIEGRPVGVVCINYSQPRISGEEMFVSRAHREDKTVFLDSSARETILSSKCAYFYSLAISPERSRRGLGRRCLELVEKEVLNRNCQCLLLETGEKTGWLVSWYERVGFRHIGKQVRNGQPVVFMLKHLRTGSVKSPGT
jgi:GNAT superfamily N-acetyltransferase